MNPSDRNDPDTLRSDIDVTRRRMDGTMDALGERLQPRHLFDELLGFLRGASSDGESRLTHAREKISRSAETAMHSITDTVKKNPVPALLIGAGIAWMIYEGAHAASEDRDARRRPLRRRDSPEGRYDPDLHYDRPLEYPPSLGAVAETQWSDQGGSKVDEVKSSIAEKASSAAGQVKEKLSHVGEVAREKADTLRERAGEKLQAAKERAGEITDQVRESTREAYTRTRERVVETVDEHPLEVGLAALAAGLIAGLALPTPNVVNRTVGPTADRLRARTREAGQEMLEKGKRVARAAAGAAKSEAEAQGLTPDRLAGKASAVAEHAVEAGKETAERERSAPMEGNQSGSQANDPSLARPAR